MGAHVELHPVMSLDDLKKGIPQAIVEPNFTVTNHGFVGLI
jgi:hypothetical protein